jgi:diguanylate cyclase (GGDEF)-like protein
MRKLPLIALLLGVALVAVGPLLVAGTVAQQHQQEEALENDATQVATAFNSYFERARSLDLLLSQNPALRSTADGTGIDAETNAEANEALGYLERLYPNSIGEACLIDDKGVEIARVTQGVPAPMDDLSADEAQNTFFKETLELEEGQVYQAAPYVSPDSGDWVISNSTPVRLANGRSLIVHFEVTLASFAPRLVTGATDRHVAVVDAESARVILTDNAKLPSPDGHFPVFNFPTILDAGQEGATTATSGAGRFVVASIPRAQGNANDWVVVQWATGSGGTMPRWVGGVVTLVGAALIALYMILLRRQHSALRMAARLDHLTGMGNRKALEEALDEAVASADRSGERVGVLVMDLDGFKQINDTLGHDCGDIVLQEIARRLHANTFEYDTAARMGGDEYAVVLRQLNEKVDVATVAHRLREALVRPIEIDGIARYVGVSIGAAMAPDHGRTGAELLRSADAAMYAAKRAREGIRVYEVGTEAGAKESWLAAELLLAIENDQITLAYQPEHALDTGEIVSVEALARWNRPGEEEIPPGQFVPLAEETGLIRELTHLTLRKALDQVQIWRAEGATVPVSVNLSARLVTDRALPGDVAALLAERGLSGDALILEITETAVIGDVGIACEVLGELRAMGVRIELDDFGSGYASARTLRDMPLDGIKVDRELVNDFSPSGRSLLAATFDMGRVLSLYIVAEGIEDEAGLDGIRTLGADVVQGYHLGRPMTADSVRSLLNGGQPAVAVGSSTLDGSPVS